MEITDILKEIIDNGPTRIVFSKPSKMAEYKKISVSKVKTGWQAECFTQKQAFHVNMEPEELIGYAVKNARSLNAEAPLW